MDAYGSHLLFEHNKLVSKQGLDFLVLSLKTIRLGEKERITENHIVKIPFNKKQTKKNYQLNAKGYRPIRFRDFWNRIEREYHPPKHRTYYSGVDDVSRNFCMFWTHINLRFNDIRNHAEKYRIESAFRNFWRHVEAPFRRQKVIQRKQKKVYEKFKLRYKIDPEFRKKQIDRAIQWHKMNPESAREADRRFKAKKKLEHKIDDPTTFP